MNKKEKTPKPENFSNWLKVGPRAHVSLAYVLYNLKGALLDSSDQSGVMNFVYGYGMVVPGLERGILGLLAGEEKDLYIRSHEAFGDVDDTLVYKLYRSDGFEPHIFSVGDQWLGEDSLGYECILHVIEINKDDVVVDGNHPLAGQDLHYWVKILSVREATTLEIKQAADNFEAAESTYFSARERSHEQLIPVVQLRKK